MNMTPKKVLANFLSVPIYSTSGVITLAALIFLIPGGIFLLAALLLCWVADRLLLGHFDDHIDTKIEEYEEIISYYRTEEDNDKVWKDFYDDDFTKK